jgi:hypothetical protein
MPKTSKFGPANRLQCPNCGEYRYLIIKGVRFEAPINRKLGLKIPFFECKACNDSEPLRPREDIMNEANRLLAENVKDNESCAVESKFEGKKFGAFDDLGFKYDSQDYYFIPGLHRPWEDGYLTPVFFNADLLLHYNNHSDYRVRLFSFSTVDIYQKDGEELIPHGFGINRNGKLFAWLGDLHEVLSREENREHLYRFLASNVESDHDVVSDSYFQQIEAEFIESDNERQILVLKKEFEDKIDKLLGFGLSKLNLEDLPIEYKHPIIDEVNQVFHAYIKLNNVLVETIQTEELKSALIRNGMTPKDIKGWRSLKLLESFLYKVLKFKDASELVCPLFVLYDLRVLGSHLQSSSFDHKYDSCKTRLDCDRSINHIDFFNAVVVSIRDLYAKLNTRLDDKLEAC